MLSLMFLRCISWPELGWTLLCLVLLYYYFTSYERSDERHVVNVITDNSPRHSAVLSDVRVVANDVNIDIKSVLYRTSQSKEKQDVQQEREIVDGFPKPRVEFIDKRRDRMFTEKTETVRILSWTPKYDNEMEWFSKEKARMCDIGSNVKCEYTSDRDLYNYTDAVLIRLRLIPEYGIPRYR